MLNAGGDEEAAGEAFWRFSLAFYARPGVADALIAIQDRAVRDVNLILFGLWLGATQGRLLAAAELADAQAAIAPIAGAAVAPLRSLRRQLRAAAEPDLQALRRRIAGLEIAAERQVQHRLAAQFSGEFGARPKGDRLAAAEANLALILGGDASSPEARLLCETLTSLLCRRGGKGM